MLPLAWVAFALVASCAAPPPPAIELPVLPERAHFTWVQTRCTDGELPLAQLGFEQTLAVSRAGEGLDLVFDSRLADRACDDLMSIWAFEDRAQGRWVLQPQARVMLPADVRCGPEEFRPTTGAIELDAQELRLTMHRSPWCRGFDATMRFRPMAAPVLTDRMLVREYLLHFARRDADGAARLFAEAATLVEPFSQHPTGQTTRHRGRDAVRRWLVDALSGPRWSALRVLSVEQPGDGGQYIATWEYMDDALRAPVAGRNLFVVADGEIFETEVQLLGAPQPNGAPPAPGAALADDAAKGAGDDVQTAIQDVGAGGD